MSDTGGLKNNTNSIYLNSLTIDFTNNKKKDISVVDEYTFEMAVQEDPEKRPYIYFNHDLSLMLVHNQNEFSADIFEDARDRTEKMTNKSNEIKWKLKYHIHRYPVILKGSCSANFLFSPSFEKYIDINYAKKRFIIRQSKDETEIGHIPSAMISISYKGRNKSEAAIRDLASRIYFYSETEVRIITKEGLDCVIDYKTHELKSAVGVDHFDVEDFSDNHILLE